MITSQRIVHVVPAGATLFLFLNRYSHLPEEHRLAFALFTLLFGGLLYALLFVMVRDTLRTPSSLLKYIFLLVVVCIPFQNITAAGGWPFNHDFLLWKNRLVMYVLHFYQGDLLPYWSAGEAYGLGAPMPVYYHKLFYWVAAPFYIVFFKIKEAILFGLVVFACVGIVGMYRALRLTGLQSWPALLLAAVYPYQYYSVTDWFVRGAFAEFSALMLTPWLIWWCIDFVKTGKFSKWIAFILVLLFYAHNIIAYFGLFAIAFALLTGLVKSNFSRHVLRSVWANGLVGAAIVVASLAVYLVPMYLLRANYNPGKIRWDMTPWFQHITDYFWDPSYNWQNINSYTVSLHPALWLFVLLFVVVLTVLIVKKELVITHVSQHIHVIAFLMICLTFCFLLQNIRSIGFYNVVPGALYIQFPWRLLTFIQPLMILVLGVMMSLYLTGSRSVHALWVTGWFLIASVLSYPVLKNPGYHWYSRSAIEHFQNDGAFGKGEYMPNLDTMRTEIHAFYKALAAKGGEVLTNGEWTIEKVPNANPEALNQEYNIYSDSAAIVILPHLYSGLERVTVTTPDSQTMRARVFRTSDDPRLRLRIAAGYSRVRIMLPNVLNLFSR